MHTNRVAVTVIVLYTNLYIIIKQDVDNVMNIPDSRVEICVTVTGELTSVRNLLLDDYGHSSYFKQLMLAMECF